MSEAEREPEAPPPPTIEWHRLDRTRPVRRVLVLAAFLVTFGATFVGAAFMTRLDESTAHTVALGGACMMLMGLVLAVGSALVMVQEDSYLAVRKDAVVLHWSREREDTVAWAELAAIEVDAEKRALVLTTRGGERHEWEAGARAKELADRLADARAKAAHGLLS